MRFSRVENSIYRASKCQRTILLKINRSVSLSNSSTEMILKCLRKRGVTLFPEYRGDSIEHTIYNRDKQKNTTTNNFSQWATRKEAENIAAVIVFGE